jgi:hypothetical protein
MGFGEVLRDVIQRQAGGHSLIVKNARIRGKVSEERLRKALEILHARHPLLRCRIDRGEENWSFVEDVSLSSIPFEVYDSKEENAWWGVMENELNTPLDSDRFLWRLKMCRAEDALGNPVSDLIFTWSHSIADGVSWQAFLRDLAVAYDNPDTDTLGPLPLLAPIEQLIVRSDDPFENAGVNRIEIPGDKIFFEKLCPIEDRRTKFKIARLPRTTEEALSARAKERDVSSHDLLSATVLKTLGKCFESISTTSFYTPYGLRNRCDPKISNEHLGCLISLIVTIHTDLQEETDPWRIAQDYRRFYTNNIPGFTLLPKEYQLKDVFGLIGDPQRNFFQFGTATSNNRNVDLPATLCGGPLLEVIGGTSRNGGDVPFLVNSSVFGEHWLLFITYSIPLVSEAKATLFEETLIAHLKELAA